MDSRKEDQPFEDQSFKAQQQDGQPFVDALEDRAFLYAIGISPAFSLAEVEQLQKEIENDRTTATLTEYQRAFDEVDLTNDIVCFQREQVVGKNRVLREMLVGARAEAITARAEAERERRRARRLMGVIAAVSGVVTGSALAFIIYRINLGY